MYIISQQTLNDGPLYYCFTGTGLIWTKNREDAKEFSSKQYAESYAKLLRKNGRVNPAAPLSVEVM